MKKILVLMLALAMLLTLCACGSENDPVTNPTDDGSVSTETLSIGISVPVLSNPFWRSFADFGEKYAKELQKMGAQNVLISLGKDGAMLIDEFGEKHKAGVIKEKVINTVGSGDSMVAGFIAGYEMKHSYPYALKLGSVCGNATAFLSGLATKEKINELLAKFN